MKKPNRACLVIVLLFGALACALACFIVAGYFLFEDRATPDVSAPAPTAEATVEWPSAIVLAQVLALDQQVSGPSSQDRDGDGVNDLFAFDFPPEQVQPSVWMTPRFAYMLPLANESASKELQLWFDNQSGQEQRFELEYEIPKEFASHVSEVTFSQEPIRVVNPDPNVVFSVILPALPVGSPGSVPSWQPRSAQDVRIVIRKAIDAGPSSDAPEARAMREAAQLMETSCQRLPADKQTDCWLAYVGGFAGFLSKDVLRAKCAYTRALPNKICLALAEGNPGICSQTSDADAQELCRTYWVAARCRPIAEQKQACIFMQSLIAECRTACNYVLDADERNECLAWATKSADYCANIPDIDKRKVCLKNLVEPPWWAQPGQTPRQPQKPAEPPAGGTGDWFTSETGAAACKQFAQFLPAYRLEWSAGDPRSLSCGFLLPNSDDSQDASVAIWVKQSRAAAQAEWDSTWGPSSQRYAFGENALKEYPGRATFTYDGISHFVAVPKDPSSSTYFVRGGRLYKQTLIEYFDFEAPSGSPATWQAIEALARKLVDERSGQ